MRVLDVSWFQYPIDTAAMAPAADGFIVRWCDWVRWANHGQDEDTGHNDVIRGFQAQGKMASSYLFARPEMSGATHQIDTWASRVNAEMTMPPGLDIEQSGITGNQLMDWTEEALQRMRAIWGWTPLHYFSNSLAAKLGTWRPSSPHLLWVPGYPSANRDYSRYRWNQLSEWVAQAGGEATVGDYLPAGYSVNDVGLWQFADTGQVPGTGNSVDVNHVYPAFAAAVGGSQVETIGTTGNDIVALARTQVGVKESPPNSNQVMYWDWWGASLGAWCAVFVSYIFHEAGVPLPAVNGPLGFVSCDSGQMFAYRHNQFTFAPEPGDIVIFSWEPWEPRDGIATCTSGRYAGQPAGDHTGIFVGWNGAPGGGFTCIEGNTSQTNWDDGGAVMERSDRDASQVCCWWRPPGLSTKRLRPASIKEEDGDDVKYSITDTDGTLYFVVNLDAYPLSGYAKTVHDATGLSKEFPHKQLPGGGNLVIDKESIRIAYVVHSVDDDVTLAALREGVNGSYANLNASLSEAQRKLDAVGGMVAGLGKPQVSTPVPVLDVEASLGQATLPQLVAALNKKLSP